MKRAIRAAVRDHAIAGDRRLERRDICWEWLRRGGRRGFGASGSCGGRGIGGEQALAQDDAGDTRLRPQP